MGGEKEEGIAQVVGPWSEGVGGGGQAVVGLEAIMQHIQCRDEDMMVPADVQQKVDIESAKWEEIWTDERGLEERAWPDGGGKRCCQYSTRSAFWRRLGHFMMVLGCGGIDFIPRPFGGLQYGC